MLPPAELTPLEPQVSLTINRRRVWKNVRNTKYKYPVEARAACAVIAEGVDRWRMARRRAVHAGRFGGTILLARRRCLL